MIHKFRTPAPFIFAMANFMEREADTMLSQKFSLSFTQFMILMHLHKNEKLNQRELARCIGVTEAAVSRQIESLTQDKLLKVMDDPEDRRRKKLTITKKGDKTLIKCIALVEDMSTELFQVLSPEEVETLKSLLAKVIKEFAPNMPSHQV
jgi:DNA-binding MarR family transcriptional regulator